MRIAANAILISIGTFIVLVVVSVTTYPGGSWLDLKAHKHDLLRNFLCDLLGPIAINGEPNPVGSVAMIIAMIVLALGLGITWWAIPGLFTSSSLAMAIAIRACGSLSLIGLLAVPLTPPAASYQLHAAAVFSGGAPAAAAWILSIFGLARGQSTRRLALLGGFALVFVVVGFALYARQYFFGGGPTLFLPASHRVATFFSVSWLLAVAEHMKTIKSETPSGSLARAPSCTALL